MIYLEPEQMGWRPLFQSWLKTLPPSLATSDTTLITDLAEWLFDPVIAFIRRNCTEVMPTADINLVDSCLRLFDSCLDEFRGDKAVTSVTNKVLQGHFVFSLTWSVCASVDPQVCLVLPCAPSCRNVH